MTKTPVYKMILVLVVIAICSGAVLSFVWGKSEGKIIENQQKLLEKAIFKLDPRTKHYKEMTKEDVTVYYCYDEGNKFVSKFFIAEGNGFQGIIKVAVSVSKDWGEVLGIEILEQVETPGLGSNIVDKEFTDRFEGLKFDGVIKVLKEVGSKEKGEVEAVTGATISSEAVGDIVGGQISILKRMGF